MARIHQTLAALFVLSTLAAGCGGGPVEGDYVGDGSSVFPSPDSGTSTPDAANPWVNPNPSTDATITPPPGTSDAGTSEAGGPVVELPDDGSGFAPLTKTLPPGKDMSGWTWVDVPGSKCRDGSGAGYYWRRGKKSSLMVYLNGGGACADPFFCGLNPVNVQQDLPIEFLIFGTGNLILGPDARPQIAPDEGVFKRDPRNPVADWNMVYVPYCTGDIHAGSRENVEVPGVAGKQQFVGFKNLGLFLDSFGPSFKNAPQVLLTGSSAGGFGSLLNYDRFAEYFKPSQVLAISDSGLPMRDKYMAACLQKKWRTYWALNDAFPKDCTACQGDAGGLTEAAFKYYFTTKYQGKFLGGLITSVNDQIIRAFFAPGLSANAGQPDDCSLDPGLNTITSALLLGSYSGDKYREGLADVADNLVGPNQIGYYGMAGEAHMHLWRPTFFNKNGNTQSIAEWMADILAGKPTKQGDNFLHPK